MRGLLVVIGLIVILALIGWVKFSKGPDRATMTIESGQIREDTKKAVQTGADLLHRAGDKVQAEVNRPSEPVAEQPKTTTETRTTESTTTETAPITR
jgi:hypothetical protein